MPKINIYYIINRITKKEDFNGTYDGCLEFYNNQNKTYRKLHRIIDNREFNKIVKKQHNYD